MEDIKKELDRIYKEVNDFQTSVDKLSILNKTDPMYSTISRGVLTAPGAKAEIILKLILRAEKITLPRTAGNENHISLQELIAASKAHLPQEVFTHLRTIQNWRNHSSHGNYLDRIDINTLMSVKTAFLYFTKWFFEEYVKHRFPGYLPKEEKKVENEPSQSTNNQPSHKPVFNQIKRYKKVILLGCLSVAVCFIAIYIGFGSSKVNLKPAKKIKVAKAKDYTNKEEAYMLIKNYYNSFNDNSSDAHNFFANRIQSYYQYCDINPTEVDILRKTEIIYVNKINAFDRDSLQLFKTTDSLIFWRFWNNFNCNKKVRGRLKPISYRIFTEFGLNRAGKIVSILELDTIKSKLRRYKKKRRH